MANLNGELLNITVKLNLDTAEFDAGLDRVIAKMEKAMPTMEKLANAAYMLDTYEARCGDEARQDKINSLEAEKNGLHKDIEHWATKCKAAESESVALKSKISELETALLDTTNDAKKYRGLYYKSKLPTCKGAQCLNVQGAVDNAIEDVKAENAELKNRLAEIGEFLGFMKQYFKWRVGC